MIDKHMIIIRPTDFHYRANYPEGTWTGNVWLALNPFPLPRDYHMNNRNDRNSYIHRGVGRVVDPDTESRYPDMPEWADRMSADLWEGVPTLTLLTLGNGRMVMHHTSAFTDQEIIEIATPIIEKYLHENAMLMSGLEVEGRSVDDLAR